MLKIDRQMFKYWWFVYFLPIRQYTLKTFNILSKTKIDETRLNPFKA